MTLDLDLYRKAQKESLESFIKFKLDTHKLEAIISDYAQMSNTHLVAVAYYTGEILGFSPEINSMINRMCKWYKIEEVKGKLL